MLLQGPFVGVPDQAPLEHEVAARRRRVDSGQRSHQPEAADLAQPLGQLPDHICHHRGRDRVALVDVQRSYREHVARGDGHKRFGRPSRDTVHALSRLGDLDSRVVGRCRYLYLQHVSSPGDLPDHRAAFVTQGGAYLADALEEAVLADMDVRPDRRHQLSLAEDLARLAGQRMQRGKRLGAKPNGLAVAAAKLRAVVVELEAGKTEQATPDNPSLQISEKFQTVISASRATSQTN